MRQGADHVSAPRPPGLKEPAVGTCHQRHCGKGDANDQLTNAAACRRFGWFHQSGEVKKHPLNCGERPRVFGLRLRSGVKPAIGLKTPRLTVGLKFRSDKNISKWPPEAVAAPHPGWKMRTAATAAGSVLSPQQIRCGGRDSIALQLRYLILIGQTGCTC